jgi:hydrophobic/amphiphilic exporter-1 (mainly G- bacteria), HAE1 family
VEDDRTIAWCNQGKVRERCIALAVRRQPGAKAMEVVEAVKALLPKLLSQLSPSVKVQMLDPQDGQAVILCQTEYAQSASFQSLCDNQAAFDKIMQTESDVQSFISMIPGNIERPGSGLCVAKLVPKAKRTNTVEQIIDTLRKKVAVISDLTVRVSQPTLIQPGSRLMLAPYQYTINSPDFDRLSRVAGQLQNKLRMIPELTDVASDLELKSSQIEVQINREWAAKLGVTAAQVEDALASALGSWQVASISSPTNEYKVILEMQPEFQNNLQAISQLYLSSQGGKFVPLSSVVSLIKGTSHPVAIHHTGQFPSVTLTWNHRSGVKEANARALVEKAASEIIPHSVLGKFGW